MQKHSGSDFKSEYLAPEFGYAVNLTASSDYDYWKGELGFARPMLYDNGSEYLIFKSRIQRDDEGNIVSANYGKMYGDVKYFGGGDGVDGAWVGFLYYFNPTPNDRNLEFDDWNNLFYPNKQNSQYEP